MKQKRRLFLRTSVIILLVLFLNLFYFAYKYGGLTSGLTGFSIKQTIEKSIQMPISSKIFLLAQWTALLSILVYSFFKDKLDIKNDTSNININPHAKNKTDLDILYDLLKKRKSMRLSTIEKSFNIKKEIAIEWAKILEAGDLAFIDYPGFGQPTLRIKETSKKEKKPPINKKDNEKQSKDNQKNKSKKKETPKHKKKSKKSKRKSTKNKSKQNKTKKSRKKTKKKSKSKKR